MGFHLRTLRPSPELKAKAQLPELPSRPHLTLSYIVLLVMDSFSFYMCEDVFISFWFLKDTSNGCRILGRCIFFSRYPLLIRFQDLPKQGLNLVLGKNARDRQGK